ncbi:hypothetical protein [Ralstonia pseudosolanacearum]|uniref:hypothetical protein n=1 Tax=Ralstonia pseudosolanacearum TaxID=1310165 RepID=UPI003CEFF9A9
MKSTQLRKLTPQQAEAVWQVLVNNCKPAGAEEERVAFIAAMTKARPPREYRIQGELGFGGKLRFPELTVDCYPEDGSDARNAIVERVNAELALLVQFGFAVVQVEENRTDLTKATEKEVSPTAGANAVKSAKPLVRVWYDKPGNANGGIFHQVLENGKAEQHWANATLQAARSSEDEDAMSLAQALVAMSPADRLNLSKTWHLPD